MFASVQATRLDWAYDTCWSAPLFRETTRASRRARQTMRRKRQRRRRPARHLGCARPAFTDWPPAFRPALLHAVAVRHARALETALHAVAEHQPPMKTPPPIKKGPRPAWSTLPAAQLKREASSAGVARLARSKATARRERRCAQLRRGARDAPGQHAARRARAVQVSACCC